MVAMTLPLALPRPDDEITDDLARLGFTLSRLRHAYRGDTSELADRWSTTFPSTGQCHVTSLIVNERHGGRILLGWTTGGDLHYWNVVHGITIDATRDQFGADMAIDRIEDATDEVLHPGTIAKRDLLALRAFGDAA
jgi:hypothetical protein